MSRIKFKEKNHLSTDLKDLLNKLPQKILFTTINIFLKYTFILGYLQKYSLNII